MSFDPTTIKTWQLVPVPRDAGKYEIRINVGKLGYGYGPANPTEYFILDAEPARGVLIQVPNGSQKVVDIDVQIDVPNSEIVLMDQEEYSGTVNGSPVSVDAIALGTTLLQDIFPLNVSDDPNNKTVYECWVTCIKGDGSREVVGTVCGDIDATTIQKGGVRINSPLDANGNPEWSKYQWTVPVAHLSNRLKTTLTETLRTTIASGDCVVGDMWQVGAVTEIQNVTNIGGGFEQHYGNVAGGIPEWAPFRYDMRALWLENDGGSPAFPGGMHGISLTKLFDNIHTACSYVGSVKSDVKSAFDGRMRVWAEIGSPITATYLQIQPGGYEAYVTAPSHGLSNGDYVRCLNFSVASGFFSNINDCLYYVQVIDSNYIKLVNSAVTGVVFPAEAMTGATIQKEGYTWELNGSGAKENYLAKDWYVQFQYMFGYNPFTGTHDLESPITYADEKPLSDIVSEWCYLLGSIARLTIDATTGDVTISLVPINVAPGVQIPSNWIPASPDQQTVEAAQTNKDAVNVNYTADEAIVCSPVVGKDAASIEIPRRTKWLGINPNTDMNYNGGDNLATQYRSARIEQINFPSTGPNGGAGGGSYIKDNGHLIPDPDGWVPASYIFVNRTCEDMYPPGGTTTPGSSYNRAWNLDRVEFTALQCIAINNGTDGSSDPDEADEKLRAATIPVATLWWFQIAGNPVLQKRKWYGVADASGMVGTSTIGMYADYTFEGVLKRYAAIEVTQTLDKDSTELQMRRYPTDWALATQLPWKPKGQAGTSTKGTIGSSTSGDPVLPQQGGANPIAVNFYDSTGTVALTLFMFVQTQTNANGDIIAVSGTLATGNNAGMVTEFQFSPILYQWGSGSDETGDVEIVGIDAAGVPGYFATMTVSYAAGDAKTNGYRLLYSGWWSRYYAKFESAQPMERTARKRRYILIGRMIVYKDSGVYTLQWIDEASGTPIPDTVTPTSATDIQNFNGTIGGDFPNYSNIFDYLQNDIVNYTDGLTYQRNGTTLGTHGHLPTDATYWDVTDTLQIPVIEYPNWNNPLSANYILATLTGVDFGAPVATEIGMTFNTRFKVVSAETFLWTYSEVGTNIGDRLYLPWNPQVGRTTGGATNTHSCVVRLSMCDFAAITATVDTTVPLLAAPVVFTNTKLYTRDASMRDLDEMRLGIIITVEPTGEDYT